MNTLKSVLLIVHIISGTISIILFWFPLFLKKGGKSHSVIGKTYVFFMYIVVFTALIMCLINLLQNQIVIALFLGFISLITMDPLWLGVSVLKQKREVSIQYRVVKIVLDYSILFYGGFLFIYSFFCEQSFARHLFLLFGVLGLLRVTDIVKYKSFFFNSKPVKTHYTSMISSGIAAYTAFVTFGGRQLIGHILTDEWMLIPWIAPTLIGFISIKSLNKKVKS